MTGIERFWFFSSRHLTSVFLRLVYLSQRCGGIDALSDAACGGVIPYTEMTSSVYFNRCPSEVTNLNSSDIACATRMHQG